MMQWHEYDDDAAVAAALAATVADDLRRAIDARGHALLALSGGNTPKQFMGALSTQQLDWGRVTVTQVDERWVPPDNPRSNSGLLQRHLLHGLAAPATFVPLYIEAPTPESALSRVAARIDALALPLDVAVLGMGSNGHTASYFAGGDRLAEALDPHGKEHVLPMRTPEAGEPRITLTLPVLIAARALYLQIEGAEKRGVLEAAVEGADYPMRAVLQAAPQLQTYWCP